MSSLDKVVLVARESDGRCKGCIFFMTDKSCAARQISKFECSPRERTDKKHVIWLIAKNGGNSDE